MARQQRIYEVTAYPTPGVGDILAWTGVLPRSAGGAKAYVYIDVASAASATWPSGTWLSRYNSPLLIDLLRKLKAAYAGNMYQMFRTLSARGGLLAEPYDDVILATPGLTHYWPLKETSGTALADLVTSGAVAATAQGSLSVGGGTPGPYTVNDPQRVGVITHAADDSYATSNSTIALAAPFSYEFWLKSSYGGGTQKALFGIWTNGVGGCVVKTGLNIPIIAIQNGGSGSEVQETTNICDGTWKHIVLTCDGTTTKLYVNAAAPETYVHGITMAGLTATLYFLKASSVYGAPVSTQMSGAALYNVELSAATITAHYAAR